ncbi:hypothetical protein GCM10010885_08370 [Alicyclobacillus cellulosilyticus]|uniref:Uncharacterized protein n=1 Tax=Alicyclobacillus cellulosilyticus TaxID=1003997 RepID=A0A917NHG2_9BACL|nr:hypothetical protein [Alicyclobacillus cellulosilyticus]GGJ01475.1 hypothetical protein GCM10010885_08370 [Alicyclobacillus cellulosilyticus]
MAVQPVHGHVAHDEHVDHQGNANLAVWLGLIALTFTTATFVATNVYLRAWSPAKFDLSPLKLQGLPYQTMLFLLISGVLLFIAGAFFVRNAWHGFRVTLALTTLSFFAVLVLQFRIMVWFTYASKQIATIYTPSAFIEFALVVLSVILLAIGGWFASFASKRRINRFFPVAMNVWLYTVFAGIVMMLLENVMTVGEFAAWCGQHLT